MYAIISKADGYPICRRVPGVEPDPVVIWNTEDAARSFIASKGGGAEFHPVQLTDECMDRIATAMGCAVQAMTFEPYPTD
jgi:hypothetical protein